MNPNFHFLFFSYEYRKYAEFHADSKSVEIIGKKVHSEKDICEKQLQVSSLEEENSNFAHLFCL